MLVLVLVYLVRRPQRGEAGLTTLVGSRDAGRGQTAVAALTEAGLAARLVVLDVRDADSVAAAAKLVDAEYGRLDVLVNNAGISLDLALPSEQDVDQLRATFETNLFGLVTTTNAFLPLLRRSAAPRIVNVSSGLGSLQLITRGEWRWNDINAPAYQASKAALNALTLLYSRQLAPAGFLVNAVSPGYRATDLGGNAVAAPHRGDPAEGALAVTRLALLSDDGPTGQFHNDTGGTHPW